MKKYDLNQIMSIYIVAIEWSPERIPETTNLEGLFNANFQWVKLTELTYLITSSNTPVEIRNFITNRIPALERIFVGEVNYSAAWRNMESDSNNIKQLFGDE